MHVSELVNEMDVLAAVTSRVPNYCRGAGLGAAGQVVQVVVLPLGGWLRASVELVNVAGGVNVIDVLAAVELCVPVDPGKKGRIDLDGKTGQVVVHPLNGWLRASVELVNVPELVNEMKVLAAVALCVPIEYIAVCG